MKYILNYNDEHLSLRLCAGPVDEETAQKKLKELAIDSMVKYGAAENAEDAEAIYEDAVSDDFDTFASVVNILSLSETIADVRCEPLLFLTGASLRGLHPSFKKSGI